MFRGDGVELSSEYDPTDYDKHDEYSDEYFTRGSYAEVTEQLVKIAVANGKSRALLGVFPDEFTDEESEELAKANVLARFHESLGKTLYSVARVPRPVDEIEPFHEGTALGVFRIRQHTVLPKLVTVVHTSRYTRLTLFV